MRLELSDRPKHSVSVNDYLKTRDESGNFDRINTLGKATVGIADFKKSKNGPDGRYTFTVMNNSKHPAYAVKLNLKNIKNGETILPAYFSEGYFNLLPGEKREISVDFPGKVSDNVEVLVTGYNL